MRHSNTKLDNYPLLSMGKSPFACGLLPKYYADMTKTFSDAFNEHLRESGARVTEIALKTGVTKDALYALKRGTTRNMAVGDAIKVAGYFDKSVEAFMGLTPQDLDEALLRKIKSLTDRERAMLDATLDGLFPLADQTTTTDGPKE